MEWPCRYLSNQIAVWRDDRPGSTIISRDRPGSTWFSLRTLALKVSFIINPSTFTVAEDFTTEQQQVMSWIWRQSDSYQRHRQLPSSRSPSLLLRERERGSNTAASARQQYWKCNLGGWLYVINITRFQFRDAVMNWQLQEIAFHPCQHALKHKLSYFWQFQYANITLYIDMPGTGFGKRKLFYKCFC